MALAYLAGGESPTHQRMNDLFQEADRRLTKALGGRSMLALNGWAFHDYLGDVYLFSTSPAAAIWYAAKKNQPGVPLVRFHNQQVFRDAATAAVDNTLDPNYLDHDNRLLGIRQVAQSFYDQVTATTGTFFLSSLGVHYRTLTNPNDGKTYRYYLRERNEGVSRVDYYGECQRYRKWSLAELIFENSGATFTLADDMDRYLIFRIHNLNGVPLTVNFSTHHSVVVPRWGSRTVRRTTVPAGYETCGTYLPWFRARDPRAYQWANCRIAGLRNNPILNPRFLFDYCRLTSIRVDPTEHWNGQKYFGPRFSSSGKVAENSDFMGDLLVQGGRIKVINQSTGAMVEGAVDGVGNWITDLAEVGVTVSEGNDGFGSFIGAQAPGRDLMNFTSNLLGTSKQVDILDPFTGLVAGRALASDGTKSLRSGDAWFPLGDSLRYRDTYRVNVGLNALDRAEKLQEQENFSFQVSWSGGAKTIQATRLKRAAIVDTLPKLHTDTVLTVKNRVGPGNAIVVLDDHEMYFTAFGLAFFYRRTETPIGAFWEDQVRPANRIILQDDRVEPATAEGVLVPAINGVSTVDSMANGRSFKIGAKGSIETQVVWRFPGWGFPDPNLGQLSLDPIHDRNYSAAPKKGATRLLDVTRVHYGHVDFSNDLRVMPGAGVVLYPDDTAVNSTKVRDATDIVQGNIKQIQPPIRFVFALAPDQQAPPAIRGVNDPVPDTSGESSVPAWWNPDACLQVLQNASRPGWYATNRSDMLTRGAIYDVADSGMLTVRPQLDRGDYNMLASRVFSWKKSLGVQFHTVPSKITVSPTGPNAPHFEMFVPAPNETGLFGTSIRPANQYASFAVNSAMHRWCQSNAVPVLTSADFPSSWATLLAARDVRTQQGGGTRDLGPLVNDPQQLAWLFKTMNLGLGVGQLADYRWCTMDGMRTAANRLGLHFIFQQVGIPLRLDVLTYSYSGANIPGDLRTTFCEFIHAVNGETADAQWIQQCVHVMQAAPGAIPTRTSQWRLLNRTRARPFQSDIYTISPSDPALAARLERQYHRNGVQLNYMGTVRDLDSLLLPGVFGPSTTIHGLAVRERLGLIANPLYPDFVGPDRGSKIALRPLQWLGYKESGDAPLPSALHNEPELKVNPFTPGKTIDVTSDLTIVDSGTGTQDGWEALVQFDAAIDLTT